MGKSYLGDRDSGGLVVGEGEYDRMVRKIEELEVREEELTRENVKLKDRMKEILLLAGRG